jgi:carbamoyl-phosphate synthase large subunit
MNILVTSISNKIPLLKAIRNSFVKEQIDLKIFGGDSNELSLGRYFVDEFWHMPVLSYSSVKECIDYCNQNHIHTIFPTRDGELQYFSSYLTQFQENGVNVMVSKLNSLKKTQDKWRFFEYLNEKNYPIIPTGLEVKDVDSDFFVVKERFGSGSKGIVLRVPREETIQAAERMENPIFQPFIEGKEYSIDVYVNRQGKSKGAIVRERTAVVNGESQITRTVRYDELEKLAMNLAEDLHLQGHVMFQVIVDKFGRYHIIECNPRFGGASTLSVAAGLDSFYWFLLEMQGENLSNFPFARSEQELTLIRHSKDLII